jgi:hypothetical protein
MISSNFNSSPNAFSFAIKLSTAGLFKTLSVVNEGRKSPIKTNKA